ncbi:DNA topoisomerase IB [Rhodococcus sp. NPDC003322]
MRLRRSDPATAGIVRRRRGRGFTYECPGSTELSADDRERIDALVIPPAWRRVWICPDSAGHIQAVGTDVAGRRQYLYHPGWRARRDEEKHERVLAMAVGLPAWREEVDRDLRLRGRGRARVEATALRLLDRGVLRIGGEEYAQDNGTRGAATLLRDHVSVHGGEVRLDFPAKSGIRRRIGVEDEPLAAAIRSLLRSPSPSERLLVFRGEDGWHELHAAEINARFEDLGGEHCSAKDLRTWHATVIAAVGLADTEPARSQRAARRAENAVMKEVAEALGNTPQVARKSYVDPRVLRAYERNTTIRDALQRARQAPSEDAERAIVERAVIRMLSG